MGVKSRSCEYASLACSISGKRQNGQQRMEAVHDVPFDFR